MESERSTLLRVTLAFEEPDSHSGVGGCTVKISGSHRGLKQEVLGSDPAVATEKS